MPATASQIAFSLLPFRSAIWSDSAVTAKFGSAARDTKNEPIETDFDSVTDAQTYVDQRGTLLGTERRRFTVEVSGAATFTGDLDYAQALPGAALIDDEKGLAAGRDCAIIGAAVDYETDKTTYHIWG